MSDSPIIHARKLKFIYDSASGSEAFMVKLIQERDEAREKELKAPGPGHNSGHIEHIRGLQESIKFLRAETAKLHAEIAELRAGAAAGDKPVAT